MNMHDNKSGLGVLLTPENSEVPRNETALLPINRTFITVN